MQQRQVRESEGKRGGIDAAQQAIDLAAQGVDDDAAMDGVARAALVAAVARRLHPRGGQAVAVHVDDPVHRIAGDGGESILNPHLQHAARRGPQGIAATAAPYASDNSGSGAMTTFIPTPRRHRGRLCRLFGLLRPANTHGAEALS